MRCMCGVSVWVHTHVSPCVCCVSVAWADPGSGGGPGEAFVLTLKGDQCGPVLFVLGWWLASRGLLPF